MKWERQFDLLREKKKKLLLDDGSLTSANLGNDHGFISEEY